MHLHMHNWGSAGACYLAGLAATGACHHGQVVVAQCANADICASARGGSTPWPRCTLGEHSSFTDTLAQVTESLPSNARMHACRRAPLAHRTFKSVPLFYMVAAAAPWLRALSLCFCSYLAFMRTYQPLLTLDVEQYVAALAQKGPDLSLTEITQEVAKHTAELATMEEQLQGSTNLGLVQINCNKVGVSLVASTTTA